MKEELRTQIQREDPVRTRRRWPSAGREASEETKSDNNLMSNFQPPEMWENKFLLFRSSHPVVVFCYGHPSKSAQYSKNVYLSSPPSSGNRNEFLCCHAKIILFSTDLFSYRGEKQDAYGLFSATEVISGFFLVEFGCGGNGIYIWYKMSVMATS